MQKFMQKELEEVVTNVHQFKLARKLALAVLQYHSTPWLSPEWSLAKLTLLTTPDQLPEDFCLYLNSTLPSIRAVTDTSSTKEVEMTEISRSPLTDMERRGIDNMTLFCLGVSLLEIGHWKSLGELYDASYDDNEIDTARRLGRCGTTLGKSYDEIIRRCLRCDFGMGTDLGRTELQSAVYSDVVCPLEEIIGLLDKVTL
jgi:hypothetical protein